MTRVGLVYVPRVHGFVDSMLLTTLAVQCVRVQKAGRLCEHTIAASPPESGGPACFEVLDLSKDARFNTLDFVAGPPHFRNYAGVPLRTRKGINIGSIFVIDSKLRPPLTTTERHFLGEMADNVMQHLEMVKDRKDCARALHMSACMSAYVDPLHSSARPLSQLDEPSFPLPSANSNPGSNPKAGNTDRLNTFRRAASFLLEGLGFDESGGGVMFLDTQPSGWKTDYSPDESSGVFSSQDSEGDIEVRASQCTYGDTEGATSQATAEETDFHGADTTEILAHATQPATDANTAGPPTAGITALPPQDLSRLVKRYPEGKLFTFDSHGHALASSSDDSSEQTKVPKSSRTYTKHGSKRETDKLRRYFPSARQIIFLPIWDSSTSRWAVCIAYHRSQFRNLSYKSEFIYCATFGNTVVAELTKLASIQNDQQKSDFIASISHELRSPLHGILASCEFLEETETTPFQKSLIGTADSCARTLLDTINMVLDYSNINKFEKMKDHARKNKHDVSANSQSKTLQTRLSMQRTVDVAALAEEVIDGLVIGHVFGGREERRTSFKTETVRSTAPGVCIDTDRPTKDGSVEVILDIAYEDWTFCTEPGAVKRILMNLVENAIKFTQDGYVHVKIESSRPKDSAAFPAILLTVTDSGQGIPPSYLRDTVFSPFFQESNLTAGTGLGLSLVKSIIRTMGGKISINSTVGIGTRATVKIPMIRGAWSAQDREISPNPTHFDNVAEWNRSTSISAVRLQALNKTAAIHWCGRTYASSTQSKALRLLQSSLATYLSRWFGLSCSPWQQDHTYDIIITTFDGLGALEQSAPQLFTGSCRDTVLIIGTAAPPPPIKADILKSSNIVVLRCPFGPAKLAHVLERCLEKSKVDENAYGANQQETSEGDVSSVGSEEGSSNSSSTTLVDTHTSDDEAQPRALQVIGGNYNGEEADANLASVVLIEDGRLESHNEGAIYTQPLPETVIELVTISILPAVKSTQLSISDTIEKPVTVAKPAVSSLCMLLVDDNAINLRLLQVYSKKLSPVQVHSAENGKVAVDTYERLLHATPSTPPTIILMDISMPVMDGFEATRRIRQIEAAYKNNLSPDKVAPRSFIIALTGLASLKDQREAFAAGVDRYLMKPASFAKLSILLEECQAELEQGT
jgi:signal transduction histidine kinase/CheY-like chemotaxis protein